MTEKKFLRRWMISAALLWGSIMLLNYLVDPYLLYNGPRIEGINAIKPKAALHSAQSKIHQARRMDLNTLIVGNSRPEMGFDPDHALFQEKDMKVFNLGLPGSSLSQQYGYALDILREKEIKPSSSALIFWIISRRKIYGKIRINGPGSLIFLTTDANSTGTALPGLNIRCSI